MGKVRRMGSLNEVACVAQGATNVLQHANLARAINQTRAFSSCNLPAEGGAAQIMRARPKVSAVGAKLRFHASSCK